MGNLLEKFFHQVGVWFFRTLCTPPSSWCPWGWGLEPLSIQESEQDAASDKRDDEQLPRPFLLLCHGSVGDDVQNIHSDGEQEANECLHTLLRYPLDLEQPSQEQRW